MVSPTADCPSRCASRLEPRDLSVPHARSITRCARAARRDVELVAGLHVERLVPGVGVAQRREGADLAGAVRAVDDLLAQGVVAQQGAPDLRPGEEDALLAGEAVEHRRRLAAEEVAIGFEAEMDSAEIADVLAHRDPRR